MSDLASSPRESVNDFNSDEDLLNELVMDEITATRPTSGAPIPAAGNAQPRETEEGSWMLYEYDAQTTEAVTAYDEFRRLQVLRSYCALDIRDETIDRLTRTAALTFGVAGAWVCLVDFKRIVYFSTHGLDGLDVIPRLGRYGCAHAIQFRADRCYVVPDMSTNSLYEDMEFVNQAPFMKFYASAPLLSPEGFRIGTFGLIDPGARPGRERGGAPRQGREVPEGRRRQAQERAGLLPRHAHEVRPLRAAAREHRHHGGHTRQGRGG